MLPSTQHSNLCRVAAIIKPMRNNYDLKYEAMLKQRWKYN